MSPTMQAGLELDGTRATIATVQDGAVAEVHTFVEDSPEAAVDRALATLRRADPVRAVVVSDGVRVRRVDLTAATLAREAFTELAYEATAAPREGTTVAGLLSDVAGVRAGLLGSGVAAVAPAEPVEALYRRLGRRPTEVVPAAFTAGALEGVSLALRHTSADLTLVVDGTPVAFAALSGGLGTVEAVLGGGTSAGQERLRAALDGHAGLDPIAVGQLERYLRAVLTEARDVLEAWARQGERVGRAVYVHGPGATARGLDVLLADAGLSRADQPAITRALVHLDPRERPAAVGAYLAASTYGAGSPQAYFPNPQRVRELETAERRRTRRRRARLVAAAAALLAVGALGPVAVGQGSLLLAQGDLDAGRGALRAAGRAGQDAADYSTLRAAVAQLGRHGRWDTLLPTLDAAAPAGVVLDAVSAQGHGADLVVTVSGTSSSGQVDAVTSYMVALRRQLKTATVQPGALTARPDGSTAFTLALTLPGGAR